MGLPAAAGEPAGLEWWSLRPLERPAVPEINPRDTGRARSPVDHFILAKLRSEGLEMSPEADRRTLVRRLTFDLTGLPPSPEETAAFVADESPDAYHDLVEKLLASPRYGERWARHWLDVIHYADTHGYDKDKPRPNAWPYRDYVIRAFNEDRPYGRFIREQLAGDVLFPESPDGVVATGFIAAGPWDLIGHAEVPEEKIDGQIARHLDRDDMSMTTMNTFCSLTVQCAQCHDHKRDPVTAEEYYQLQAVFSALDRADRPYDPDPETLRLRRGLESRKRGLESQLADVEARVTAAKPPGLLAVEAEIEALEQNLGTPGESGGDPRLGYHSEVATGADATKWVQVDLGKTVPVDDVLLFGAEEYGFADFGFPRGFRIEVSNDNDFIDGVRPIAVVEEGDRIRPGSGAVRFSAGGASARYIRVTATKLWSRRRMGGSESNDWIFALGEISVLSGGGALPIGTVEALDSIEAAPRWARANLVDSVAGHRTLPKDAEGLLAMAGEGDAERVARQKMLEGEAGRLLQEAVPPTLLAERDTLVDSLAKNADGLAALPAPSTVYAGNVHTGNGAFKGTGESGGRPRVIHLLDRGDVRKPRGEVGPGAPAIIPGLPAPFDLPPGHPEGARRAALADWITRADNPLTWRSIVNRVWLYHFGNGIVGSPNDFGRMGQLPTHPSLLDWLAVEFRDGGQSIKDLHRLLVSSAAYRQSSDGSEGNATDASNRFLWRMNRRKLEAEALRDSMLMVAGKLDTTMYGPGFQDFVIEKPEHSPHYNYRLSDVSDPASYRRSIYRFIVRSQPQPFLDTLDCADPTLLVDKRNETITALQALALLNNRFVIHMAGEFAGRIGSERSSPEAQIRRVYALALGRSPGEDELAALKIYHSEHGPAAVCRLVFNLNEFAFVE